MSARLERAPASSLRCFSASSLASSSFRLEPSQLIAAGLLLGFRAAHLFLGTGSIVPAAGALTGRGLRDEKSGCQHEGNCQTHEELHGAPQARPSGRSEVRIFPNGRQTCFSRQCRNVVRQPSGFRRSTWTGCAREMRTRQAGLPLAQAFICAWIAAGSVLRGRAFGDVQARVAQCPAPVSPDSMKVSQPSQRGNTSRYCRRAGCPACRES